MTKVVDQMNCRVSRPEAVVNVEISFYQFRLKNDDVAIFPAVFRAKLAMVVDDTAPNR